MTVTSSRLVAHVAFHALPNYFQVSAVPQGYTTNAYGTRGPLLARAVTRLPYDIVVGLMWPQADDVLSARKYIFYSTIATLFSDRFVVTIGVNLFLSYVFIVVNLVLLWKLGYLWFPKGLLFFIGYIFLSGIFGIATGTGSLIGFAKDITGIVPDAIYLCAFFRFMKFDYERCFAAYAKVAFYLAILGLVMFPFQSFPYDRLTSIITEPAGFCIICGPALYYYAETWLAERKYGWRVLVLLAAVILTYSSVGFMGILFGIYLLGARYRFGAVFAPVVIAAVSLLIYTTSTLFEKRLDDSLLSLRHSDLSGINISSFGVVANIFVTERAFAAHPIIGGGLGSYVTSFDKFSNGLIGIDEFQAMGLGQLSRWDASSLLLRIAAEFGLLGLTLAGWFLVRGWPGKSSANRRIIAKAIFCFMFMKIIRSGEYFDTETLFFLIGYAVNGLVARTLERGGAYTFAPTSPVLIAHRQSSVGISESA